MTSLVQEVLTQTPLIYLVLDPDGTVNFVSPGLQKVLGMLPETTIGKNWFELTRRDASERQEIRTKVDRFVASTERLLPNYIECLRDARGQEVHILWNTIKTGDNQLVGTGHDITQQVLQEKQLSQMNRSLRQLHTKVSDSINYAARLQQAILKNPAELRNLLPGSAIFYRPKDTVSGDLYFFTKVPGYTFIAAIDCTGHGVPGAMLSIIANTFLRDILRRGIVSCSEILNTLDFEFVNYLNENNPNLEIADGMDIALVRISDDYAECCYSGAFRPLMLIRKGQVETMKASKYPIGLYSGVEKSFEEVRFSLEEKDMLVLFTDGFPDQFGGEKGKKFNRKRFTELFLHADDFTGEELEQYLEYSFENWKQQEEQTDDVTVLCIRK